jgi:iron(III) transport system substrate-binding protein
MGRDFIGKLSRQDVKVHNVSGVALEGLIVSGEVPLSPSVFNTRVIIAKQKGAPVEWYPLEPVVANVGYSGLTTKAPHPHAALLFLDYLHSNEGQRILVKEGAISPRLDVVSAQRNFKKTYFETKYTFEEFEKKFDEWEKLLMELFIRRR